MKHLSLAFAVSFGLLATTLPTCAETQPPTVRITSPLALQRVTNTTGQVTIRGKASDNVGVANVQIQLNGGDWVDAISDNGWTNWTATATPIPRTNIVKAVAMDSSGNTSLTNTVRFNYVVTSPLTLITNGVGTVVPSFHGTLLEVGRTYAITAVPGWGQLFSGWSGSISSGNPTLAFVMQSNMVLQANFTPNPVARAKGFYNGLFTETKRRQARSGFFSMTLTANGAYSASLRRGTNSYPFSGQFDITGIAANAILVGTNVWTITMALDLAGAAEQLTGAVAKQGHWQANLLANRAVFNAQTNLATQYVGSYTLIIPGSTNASTIPGGDSFATLAVGPGGNAAIYGSLADGAALSEVVPVSRNGAVPLYVPLYGGKGSVLSWLAFDGNFPSTTAQGDISWIKPARSKDQFYPNGFTNSVPAVGSRYTPPTTNRVINLTDGEVIFDGGNLPAPFNNLITLTSTNRIIDRTGSNGLKLNLNLANGLFSGTVKVPGSSRIDVFLGALLQNADSGYGYFLGTNQSGSVFLGNR